MSLIGIMVMVKMSRPKVIAVDFDGTLVENDFPDIGSKNDNVVNYVREESNNGSIIILWTTRQNEKLKEAIDFLDENNIPYNYVNENARCINFDTSDKIFADIYLDDRAKNPFGGLDNDRVQLTKTDKVQEVIDNE